MNMIELPRGFRYSGVACGIKPSGKPDLSLIVADRPAVASGVYTLNQVVAAPVLLCKSRTPSDSFRAVVTNSGNANACTGTKGEQDASEMCRRVAEALSAAEQDVLVMSTGVIGQTLPMQSVRSGIDAAVETLGTSVDDYERAAEAILTTDQSTKVECRTIELQGKPVRIAAMAKGAGMIAPNMATMLAVMTTDADLQPEQSQRMLQQIADKSFNLVSVDGHTSTNDTLLMLSSGESGVVISDDHESEFLQATTEIAQHLARMLVADGEGATHVMQIQVRGAVNDQDAAIIARTIGASPLVKTAITGGDPNWGRIVSAAGYAGPKIVPNQTSLSILGTNIYKDGAPSQYDEKKLSDSMKQADVVELELVVGSGSGQATHWASDLTVEYVRFNSEYTT